ncbi:hypothetical protein CUN91_01045 [Candidatus Carsonella ruddii]|uniref:Uncharacterized protein n=1 Tax=Carsonella ruddii TaxID=114186 RepID=A0A2K8K4K8_CARRU|nr:SufE family protein [Candidatus Carsonella ruddii]ATX33529.1 hypothetical protein CUN91_01045 [Candidatus Carsonella ruddii]
MINKIKKVKKKFFKNKNIYNFLIKIGIQKKNFLKENFLINNCLINTWIKIIKKKFFFFFGYSNSLFLSGIIKIFFLILNKNLLNNIKILFKFNILKILKIEKKITNFRKESFNNILYYIYNFIINN